MRTYWNISYYSDSNVWISDGKIPSSGKTEFSDSYESNASTIILADGNMGRSTSETPISSGRITLSWPRVVTTSTLRTKMKALQGSGAGIKITTHVSGVSLEGYIDRIDDRWALTGIPQEYEFVVDMQIMSVD